MCASLSGCHGDDVSGISGNSDEYAAMEIGVHGFRTVARVIAQCLTSVDNRADARCSITGSKLILVID
jgi:hypothetical protein